MPPVRGAGGVRSVAVVLAALMLVPTPALVDGAAGQQAREISENAQMDAVAVARTQSGETIGTTATISVSVSTGGGGGVFLDTQPLSGTDMQGSARIAARVAASLTGYAVDDHDFYFVVRSDSPVISGPSAGSVMALTATVALQNVHKAPDEPRWNITEEVLVTGTINPDGSIGAVGGIPTKAEAARDAGASLFLVPEGQGVVGHRTPETGQTRTVEIGEFCEDELRIVCREVGHVKELVELATGHRFVEPELGEPPTTAGYEDTLAPLADRLIERGRLYQDVWDRLNRSQFPRDVGRQIVAVLQAAQRDVHRAEANVEGERFYSAASRAFGAAIQARHAELLFTYHDRGREAAVVESAIANATEQATEARRAAGQANVTGMQDLYTVGAAQKRVANAEFRAQEARNTWENDVSAADALRLAARSMERSATVHWWLSLSEAFGPGAELPVPVDQLADEMMDLADELIAYTSEVLGDRQPREAARSMRQARDNARQGFHAGAAVQAAEAQVTSALSVELRTGSVTDSKVDRARESATRAIQEARGLGVEPVLPIALFEFGGVQEEPGAALQFYRTASVLAGMSNTLETEADPTPTEFVGPWEGETPQAPIGHSYRSVAVGWFTVGLFATLIVGLFVAGMRSPGRR
jgi:uncharacterized protein